jgi:hypothetical protein
MTFTRRKPSIRSNKTKKKIHKLNTNNNFYKRGTNNAPHCSPTSKNDYTCFNDDSLNKLRKYWNARHPDNKIKNHDARTIWKSLRNNMENVCNNEKCWLNQKFIKHNLDSNLRQYTFAPDAPYEWESNLNTWLSSTDIIAVMKQYEKRYKCFEFIGPSPINFDQHLLYGECVWEELCRFNLITFIARGKTKIGIIFNTDPHWKEGSHWVSLFINIHAKQPYIYYFDSNGSPPPSEIRSFIQKVYEQSRVLGINIVKSCNRIRHQKSNTECGMYALYFIIQILLDNMNYTDFENEIPDEFVEQFRKIYFN